MLEEKQLLFARITQVSLFDKHVMLNYNRKHITEFCHRNTASIIKLYEDIFTSLHV